MDQKKDTLKLFADIARRRESLVEELGVTDAVLASREFLENAEELKREAQKLPGEIAELQAKKDALRAEGKDLQQQVESLKAELHKLETDWQKFKQIANG